MDVKQKECQVEGERGRDGWLLVRSNFQVEEGTPLFSVRPVGRQDIGGRERCAISRDVAGRGQVC